MSGRAVVRAACWPSIAASILAAAAVLPIGPRPADGHPHTGAAAQPANPRVLVDDFEDVSRWSAHPADGVGLTLRPDSGVHGRALRLDFSFSGGGYAVVRRAVDLDLPANYRFKLAVRGECLPNDLELKLIDSTGDNVWWFNRRGFAFPARWDSLSTKKRQISFAWGPAGGGDIRHVAAIEIAVTAGRGGTGTVWLDDFTLEQLPPADAAPPVPTALASSERNDHAAALAIDGDSVSAWRSDRGDAAPWLMLDLGREREFGGLVIDWESGLHAPDYAIETSDDGERWRRLREVRGANGGRDYVYLPESEARHVLVRAVSEKDAKTIGIRSITVQPLEWSATPNDFFQAIAKDAPRGNYPRGMSGEQVYWSVVGNDRDREEALLSEDGMLEAGKGRFSIEPFLFDGKRLVTWSDVSVSQVLPELPFPRQGVRWRANDLELYVQPTAVGPPGQSAVWVNYTVRNNGKARKRITLYLALRPFQVNPPSQFLNSPGGFAPIRSIDRVERVIRVDDRTAVMSLAAPSGFGAVGFNEGDLIADYLRRGRLPGNSRVSDSLGFASGALSYDLDLRAGEERHVAVVVPLGHDVSEPLRAVIEERPVQVKEPRAFDHVRTGNEQRLIVDMNSSWEARRLPHLGLPYELSRTVTAQLWWILINRDSAGIQPGSRAYERSWIRDGALTSSALLRLGQPDVVREYIDWFASFQYADGKVPCCVDHRGADPVPEHDSGGEFIFLVAEYYRYTGDRATIERVWPAVAKAAAYLDSLRRQRRTPEWRAAGKEEFFGLLPPSISHEGYSAKPMHSYWDDFFALRGFKDALYLAEALGKEPDRARLASIRDEFARDLSASIGAAMKRHKIDYVPGCADLGDFDATSTTIALDPVAAGSVVPPGALQRTFERYWEFFRERRDGGKPWENFTPYEIRNIGAFVRLGWRERANELLEFFMKYRRPEGWRQWSEVVWRDERTPHFIGDMPHTWVGSDFVRSVLDMVACQRESDDALVLGAGVPWSWIAPDSGMRVAGLPTPYGALGCTMKARGEAVEVTIGRLDRMPGGGVVVNPPAKRAFTAAVVNGVGAPLTRDGAVVVRELPATVVLRP